MTQCVKLQPFNIWPYKECTWPLGMSAVCHVYLLDIAYYSESEAAHVVLLSYIQKVLCMSPHSFFFLVSSLNKQVLAAGSLREPLWIRWSEKEGSAGAMDSRGNAPPPATSAPRTAFSELIVCCSCSTYILHFQNHVSAAWPEVNPIWQKNMYSKNFEIGFQGAEIHACLIFP